MFVSAKQRIGPWRRAMVVDRATGEKIGTAYEADTDAGWYMWYPVDPETGLVKTEVKTDDSGDSIRVLVTEKVADRPFDVVDRETGEVLAESR